MKHGLLTLAAGTAAAALFMAGADAAAPRTDQATALHVLNRLTFGARPGDVDRVRQMGVTAYVDLQLHPERVADDAARQRVAGFETLTLSSRDIAERYELPLLAARLAARRTESTGPTAAPQDQARRRPGSTQRLAQLPMLELAQQKLLRAVYSERQLEEVLTDFWFNHFNVDARKGPTRFMLTEYERDTIRPHVLGSFRELLGATAKSPAMLFYLDNWMSAAPDGTQAARMDANAQRSRAFQRRGGATVGPGRPRTPAGASAARQRRNGLNENYGRELLELHTLGVDGGYTQQDVTEVARAFTGWTIDRPRAGGGFRFVSALHDDGEKVVLGHRIKAGGGERDGEQVLDLLAEHPATARFISMKLARRFVSDAPPQALVARMAESFTASGGDLRTVMRVLLTSAEFLSADHHHAKVKTPFEFVVSALRGSGASVTDARPLVQTVQQLGMPLYQCQPPTGYTDTAEAWVNTGALVNRMNVAVQLARGELRGVSVSELRDAAALIQGPVSEATRTTLARAQTPPQSVALALGSPEFQRR